MFGNVSAYALGYAGLKVLSNIYPHHQDDDFEKEMMRSMCG